MADPLPPLTVTIDASTWVAAAIGWEPAHEVAEAALRRVIDGGHPVRQPLLMAVEIAGAVVRRTSDPALAADSLARFQAGPGVVFEPLTDEVARAAIELALATRLRAADAIYLATAAAHDATLLTLDEELVRRAPPGIRVTTPARFLAEGD